MHGGGGGGERRPQIVHWLSEHDDKTLWFISKSAAIRLDGSNNDWTASTVHRGQV